MINQLRSNLEKKSFESAAIFHKIGQYERYNCNENNEGLSRLSLQGRNAFFNTRQLLSVRPSKYKLKERRISTMPPQLFIPLHLLSGKFVPIQAQNIYNNAKAVETLESDNSSIKVNELYERKAERNTITRNTKILKK